MTTIKEIDESGFSDDYGFLAKEMQNRSLICIVDYLGSRDVCRTIYHDDGVRQVASRGHSHLWAENEAAFIERCRSINLKFVPNPG